MALAPRARVSHEPARPADGDPHRARAARAFHDPANVVREGANPGNIQTLFGGTGVINALDGTAHAARKVSVSAALSRDAIESTFRP